MPGDEGLLAAYALDGTGQGTELDWAGVTAWKPGAGFLWVHLDYTAEPARKWLHEQSRLDPTVVEVLTAGETRPRSIVTHGGLLVILRGMNFNPNSDPEDMVAIRIWIEEHRIVTTRHRRLRAVDDLRAALAAGRAPKSPANFLVAFADILTTRMGSVLADLDDQVDSLEDEVLSAESYDLRTKLGAFRRRAISIRRYLSPQREVMARLQNERIGWMDDLTRVQLRELADRTTRYVEDLDAARDRAAVAQDELNGRLSEQMNKTMYVLSIVAGIFLPLGLLTGLLGINVGGIPGTENPWAFAAVCVILVAVAALQFWIFRRKHWL
ncbi:MAG: zinc transporter ZntB [Gemmatimonadota bacterium]|nr:MAG: zinc transporter ZntB [Gemmatimonadota bacterium]